MRIFILLLCSLALLGTGCCHKTPSKTKPPIPAGPPKTSSLFGDPPVKYKGLYLTGCKESFKDDVKWCLYAHAEKAGCILLATTSKADRWKVFECPTAPEPDIEL